MLPKPLRLLWGDLSTEEVKKFSILSVTLAFIIGAYWLLRPIKDGVFVHTVGIEYQPFAKIVSVVWLVFLVMFYSKLVDLLEKDRLFYVICTAYMVVFSAVALGLAHPTIGLANIVTSPYRIIGWVQYLAIESFGSLVVALFWSFVASNTLPESAKRGYAMVIFGAQFGSIAGPTLATFADIIPVPALMGVAAISIGCIMGMIAIFMRVIPRELAQGTAKADNKPKTGMMEGLRLLLSRPYILGVFGIATLYEIVGTILDYQMKYLATPIYPTAASYTQFMARFGQCANTLALVMALLGTSALMRRFGLTFCLMLFPVIVGVVVGYVYISPTLWVLFGAMMAIKGFSYALNNPTKEVMYIPTSKDVKFKAKGWIDVFGNRLAKGTGSFLNHNILRGAAFGMVELGCMVSFGVIAFWLFVAAYVGRTFNKLTSENKIVE